MNKNFIKWLIAFVVLEMVLARLALQVKTSLGWRYNYALIPIFIILTWLALKWSLLEIEKKSAALAVVFVLFLKLVLNGIPLKISLNSNLIWQLFPSFFEEVIFRGILFKNLAEFELNNKYLRLGKFPAISMIAVCFIFAAGHPVETFFNVFDASLYFSMMYVFTKSYVAVGLDHFLQNTYSNFWE
ncbi:MAG: CPBP family glutamic-type intramembrane protease [Oligoflexales bacterium]